MKRTVFVFLLMIGIMASCGEPRIQVIENQEEWKVDVIIDGEYFTSYIWPSDMEKPVLYPIKAANGSFITRGFPLDPRPGERVDHPHHVGHWFNYGNVNGLDFWNNSYAIKADKKDRYGKIVHEQVVNASGGNEAGLLEVESSWKDNSGKTLLKENTLFIFSGDENTRSIERITKLTATDQEIVFTDNKEGMFAIRMDRSFEFPSDQPEIFTDASGIPTEVKQMNNEGVDGHYLSSEGFKNDAVWGSRAKWVELFAKKENTPISVSIIDHPKNPGHPTYWHARTYGLFSANPLGQRVFSEGEKEFNLTLAANESVTFKYQIFIESGEITTTEELNKLSEEFAKR